MFFHKIRTDVYKYTYVTGIVIYSINRNLKIVIVSQSLTKRRCLGKFQYRYIILTYSQLNLPKCSISKQIWASCQSTNRISMSPSSSVSSSVSLTPIGFLWYWCWSTTVYHTVMTTAVGGVAAAVNYRSDTLSSDIVLYLGYTIVATCVLEKILRDIQVSFTFIFQI